jgi:hypothetical protein
MANAKHHEPLVHPGKDGIHVGDVVVRPGPAFGTDGRLDTPESRDRDRRKEEDERAAQHAAGTAGAVPDPLAGEGLDDAIAEARDRVAPAPEVPIILRDPVTGELVGKL